MHKPEFVEIVLFRKTVCFAKQFILPNRICEGVADWHCPVFEFGFQTVKFLGN